MNRWMKSVGMLAGVGLAATVASSVALSQQQGEMTPEQAQAMQNWQDYATPGKEHEMLKHFAGEWDVKMVMWEEPGSAPNESMAESHCKMIYDGKFLVEKMKGTFDWGGMTFDFEGMGTTGYDNLQDKYVFTWMDNMGTGIMTGYGTSTDGGKTIKFQSECPNPVTMEMEKCESVSKIVNDDTHMFIMYKPDSNGKMFKHMEATYMRKK
ncbi:MAG: DUF1579 family protein [Planctomycetota bacterium]|nr:DUF1579 family protein [Planctomycetota bacterium]